MEKGQSKPLWNSEWNYFKPSFFGDPALLPLVRRLRGFICGPALALAPAPPLPQLSISCL